MKGPTGPRVLGRGPHRASRNLTWSKPNTSQPSLARNNAEDPELIVRWSDDDQDEEDLQPAALQPTTQGVSNHASFVSGPVMSNNVAAGQHPAVHEQPEASEAPSAPQPSASAAAAARELAKQAMARAKRPHPSQASDPPAKRLKSSAASPHTTTASKKKLKAASKPPAAPASRASKRLPAVGSATGLASSSQNTSPQREQLPSSRQERPITSGPFIPPAPARQALLPSATLPFALHPAAQEAHGAALQPAGDFSASSQEMTRLQARLYLIDLHKETLMRQMRQLDEERSAVLRTMAQQLQQQLTAEPRLLQQGAVQGSSSTPTAPHLGTLVDRVMQLTQPTSMPPLLPPLHPAPLSRFPQSTGAPRPAPAGPQQRLALAANRGQDGGGLLTTRAPHPADSIPSSSSSGSGSGTNGSSTDHSNRRRSGIDSSSASSSGASSSGASSSDGDSSGDDKELSLEPHVPWAVGLPPPTHGLLNPAGSPQVLGRSQQPAPATREQGEPAPQPTAKKTTAPAPAALAQLPSSLAPHPDPAAAAASAPPRAAPSPTAATPKRPPPPQPKAAKPATTKPSTTGTRPTAPAPLPTHSNTDNAPILFRHQWPPLHRQPKAQQPPPATQTSTNPIEADPKPKQPRRSYTRLSTPLPTPHTEPQQPPPATSGTTSVSHRTSEPASPQPPPASPGSPPTQHPPAHAEPPAASTAQPPSPTPSAPPTSLPTLRSAAETRRLALQYLQLATRKTPGASTPPRPSLLPADSTAVGVHPTATALSFQPPSPNESPSTVAQAAPFTALLAATPASAPAREPTTPATAQPTGTLPTPTPCGAPAAAGNATAPECAAAPAAAAPTPEPSAASDPATDPITLSTPGKAAARTAPGKDSTAGPQPGPQSTSPTNSAAAHLPTGPTKALTPTSLDAATPVAAAGPGTGPSSTATTAAATGTAAGSHPPPAPVTKVQPPPAHRTTAAPAAATSAAATLTPAQPLTLSDTLPIFITAPAPAPPGAARRKTQPPTQPAPRPTQPTPSSNGPTPFPASSSPHPPSQTFIPISSSPTSRPQQPPTKPSRATPATKLSATKPPIVPPPARLSKSPGISAAPASLTHPRGASASHQHRTAPPPAHSSHPPPSTTTSTPTPPSITQPRPTPSNIPLPPTLPPCPPSITPNPPTLFSHLPLLPTLPSPSLPPSSHPHPSSPFPTPSQYTSPLLPFRSYALTPQYPTLTSRPLLSPSHCHLLDPHWPLDPHEARGLCLDPKCPYQKRTDYHLNSSESLSLLRHMAGPFCIAINEATLQKQLDTNPSLTRTILLEPPSTRPPLPKDLLPRRRVPPEDRARLSLNPLVPLYTRAPASLPPDPHPPSAAPFPTPTDPPVPIGLLLRSQLLCTFRTPQTLLRPLHLILSSGMYPLPASTLPRLDPYASALKSLCHSLQPPSRAPTSHPTRYFTSPATTTPNPVPDTPDAEIRAIYEPQTDPTKSLAVTTPLLWLNYSAALLSTHPCPFTPQGSNLPDHLQATILDVLRRGLEAAGPHPLLLRLQCLLRAGEPAFDDTIKGALSQAPGCYHLRLMDIAAETTARAKLFKIAEAVLHVAHAPPPAEQCPGQDPFAYRAACALDLFLRLASFCIGRGSHKEVQDLVHTLLQLAQERPPPASPAHLTPQPDFKVHKGWSRCRTEALRAVLQAVHGHPRESLVLWLAAACLAATGQLPQLVVHGLGYRQQGFVLDLGAAVAHDATPAPEVAQDGAGGQCPAARAAAVLDVAAAAVLGGLDLRGGLEGYADDSQRLEALEARQNLALSMVQLYLRSRPSPQEGGDDDMMSDEVDEQPPQLCRHVDPLEAGGATIDGHSLLESSVPLPPLWAEHQLTLAERCWALGQRLRQLARSCQIESFSGTTLQQWALELDFEVNLLARNPSDPVPAPWATLCTRPTPALARRQAVLATLATLALKHHGPQQAVRILRAAAGRGSGSANAAANAADADALQQQLQDGTWPRDPADRVFGWLNVASLHMLAASAPATSAPAAADAAHASVITALRAALCVEDAPAAAQQAAWRAYLQYLTAVSQQPAAQGTVSTHLAPFQELLYMVGSATLPGEPAPFLPLPTEPPTPPTSLPAPLSRLCPALVPLGVCWPSEDVPASAASFLLAPFAADATQMCDILSQATPQLTDDQVVNLLTALDQPPPPATQPPKPSTRAQPPALASLALSIATRHPTTHPSWLPWAAPILASALASSFPTASIPTWDAAARLLLQASPTAAAELLGPICHHSIMHRGIWELYNNICTATGLKRSENSAAPEASQPSAGSAPPSAGGAGGGASDGAGGEAAGLPQQQEPAQQSAARKLAAVAGKAGKVAAGLQKATAGVRRPLSGARNAATAAVGVQAPAAGPRTAGAATMLTSAASAQQPAAGVQKSAAGSQKPVAGPQKPAASAQQAKAGVQNLAAGVQKPAVGAPSLAAGAMDSAPAGQKPPSGAQGRARTQTPAAGAQQPAAAPAAGAPGIQQSAAVALQVAAAAGPSTAAAAPAKPSAPARGVVKRAAGALAQQAGTRPAPAQETSAAAAPAATAVAAAATPPGTAEPAPAAALQGAAAPALAGALSLAPLKPTGGVPAVAAPAAATTTAAAAVAATTTAAAAVAAQPARPAPARAAAAEGAASGSPARLSKTQKRKARSRARTDAAAASFAEMQQGASAGAAASPVPSTGQASSAGASAAPTTQQGHAASAATGGARSSGGGQVGQAIAGGSDQQGLVFKLNAAPGQGARGGRAAARGRGAPALVTRAVLATPVQAGSVRPVGGQAPQQAVQQQQQQLLQQALWVQQQQQLMQQVLQKQQVVRQQQQQRVQQQAQQLQLMQLRMGAAAGQAAMGGLGLQPQAWAGLQHGGGMGFEPAAGPAAGLGLGAGQQAAGNGGQGQELALGGAVQGRGQPAPGRAGNQWRRDQSAAEPPAKRPRGGE